MLPYTRTSGLRAGMRMRMMAMAMAMSAVDRGEG
jgi:hypothetical protein